ncbi:MAG: hypothetical protein JWO31_1584 [Phycisphaerales bacterium]|nr:hypothetical protein [Phycisphaerales bacterium]
MLSTDVLSQLTSTAGIVALVVTVMAGLKPKLAAVRYLSAVPGWVYTVLVAAGVTYLANRVFGTLPGDLATLTYQVAVNALLSIGTYHVGGVVAKPIAASVADDAAPGAGTAPKLMLLALALSLVGGCGSTPADRYLNYSGALDLGLQAMADARDLGLLKQAEADAARQYVDAALAARATAKKHLDAGDPAGAAAALDELRAALATLGPVFGRAGTPTPKGPATHAAAVGPTDPGAGDAGTGVRAGGDDPPLTPPR